ncbi:MAG TPA: ABC transporter substrate-binding protein [Stellaceae bacterium]|nr:ABC transporter substrate-binding protein [Stellaceae bacterium]
MRQLLTKIAIAALALCVHHAAAAELTSLRIEVPKAGNLQYFTLWVALGAGAFQQEGLAPELVIDDTPQAAGSALLKGEADIAVMPPPMFLGAMAEGKPILLFASLLANEPIDFVVSKEVAEARHLSSAASLRDRLQALKGIKVGVAGGPPPRLQALFASVGMNANEDIDMVLVWGRDQVQAFAARQVDALFAHTPYLETVLAKHGAVLVADLSGGEVAELAHGQIHALATSRVRAEAAPDLIAAATRAIYRAERLIHSDRKATVDAVLASGVKEFERTLVETIAAIYSPAVPVTPAISLAGIERDAELFPAFPRKPDFSVVKAADFVAPGFAADAVKALP